MTCDTWHVKCDTWQMTHDRWHMRGGEPSIKISAAYLALIVWKVRMICDTWHVTPDMWHLTCETWHVTPDNWHLTCVISLAKSKYLQIFGIFFWKTINCHFSSTVRAFDLIPKLRTRPEYQLSSGYKYTASRRYFIQIETYHSFLHNHSCPKIPCKTCTEKFRNWL